MPPFVFYILTLIAFFFIYAILNWGLNIQFGETGILNFAYIAFVAVGAYFTGVLTMGPPKPGSGQSYIIGSHVPFPLNLLAGGLAAAALGVLVSFIAFRRLRSDYLAIVMISLSTVLYDVINNWTAVFDGADGLNGVPQPFIGALRLNANTFLYVFPVFALVVAAVLWWVVHRLSEAPLGRTLRAVRDDPDVARALGKNVFRYQMLAMVIGSFYAGIGGGLLIELTAAFNTSAWTAPETFVIFAALIVGGLANNVGGIVGALLVPVIFVQLPKFLPSIPGHPSLIPDIDNMVIGVLLMLVLWFRPQGVVPERRRRFDRLSIQDAIESRRRSQPGGVAPVPLLAPPSGAPAASEGSR